MIKSKLTLCAECTCCREWQFWISNAICTGTNRSPNTTEYVSFYLPNATEVWKQALTYWWRALCWLWKYSHKTDCITPYRIQIKFIIQMTADVVPNHFVPITRAVVTFFVLIYVECEREGRWKDIAHARTPWHNLKMQKFLRVRLLLSTTDKL